MKLLLLFLIELIKEKREWIKATAVIALSLIFIGLVGFSAVKGSNRIAWFLEGKFETKENHFRDILELKQDFRIMLLENNAILKKDIEEIFGNRKQTMLPEKSANEDAEEINVLAQQYYGTGLGK